MRTLDFLSSKTTRRSRVKPVGLPRLSRFVAHAIGGPAALRHILAAWAARYGLTDAETDVLRRGAVGESRESIGRERRSSHQTINKHVANLLRRTGDASLQVAIARILREIALRSQ